MNSTDSTMRQGGALASRLAEAADVLRRARHVTAFTGAGISVESGIPSFRGAGGLWSKYNPECLDIWFFHRNTEAAWSVIREIFYDFFGKARPNDAHLALAAMERAGKLHAVITQNIDNLHHDAGSGVVYEFHGNSRLLRCLQCNGTVPAAECDLRILPPRCACGGIFKPDFVFFGEGIPEPAQTLSFREAERADVMLLVGTTGEVYPAALIPREAKRRGAIIIEVNPEHSEYTSTVTDIFLQGKAAGILRELAKLLGVWQRPEHA
jgi:NAD-dependent deacetylase